MDVDAWSEVPCRVPLSRCDALVLDRHCLRMRASLRLCAPARLANCLAGAASLIAVAAIAPPAHADPDTVVVKGGSVLTGTIEAMDRGNLEFAIANVGTVDIDWQRIERLASERSFEVELTTGEHLSGPLRGAVSGELEVRAPMGPRIVPMSNVLRLRHIGATLLQRTTGSVDFGFEYLQANHQVAYTFDADAENRTRFYLTEARFSSLLTHLSGADAASRNDFALQTRRLLREGWFVPVQFLFQQDKALDLNSRFLIGVAGGKYLIQTLGTVVGAHLGVDYAVSNYEGVPGTDHAVEGLGTAEWDWFESASKTELKTFVTTYLGLNESHVRVEWAADIRRDFFRTFYWTIHLFDSYNSNPPAPVRVTNDFGLSFAIGYSF